jgi:hypothetical protein
MLVRTLRDVREGEELCVSYVDLLLPKEERREKLLGTKYFYCGCERCDFVVVEAMEVVEVGGAGSGGDGGDWEVCDPDYYLEGHLCSECNDGESIYVPPKNQDNDGDDGEWKCFKCQTRIPASKITSRKQTLDTEFHAGLDFLPADPHSAKHSLRKFIHEKTSELHRNHHLLLSAHSSLANLTLRHREFKETIKHLKHVVAVLESYCPPNWPELGDYVYRLAETLEIHAKAMEMGLGVGLEEGDTKEDADGEMVKVVLVESKEAFKRCYEMRKVAYGESHVKTTEAHAQYMRLEEEL